MGNVDKVRAGHQAFNDRDFKKAATTLLSDTSEFTDHGRGVTLHGATEFVGWLEGFVAMSSDIKIVDAVYIDAGEHVTARFSATGTQDGPMDPFPASGKPYHLDICEVWSFGPDGKSTEGHNYSDGLGLLAQLGHIEM